MASTGQHTHSPYRLLGHVQHSIFTVFDFLFMRTCCALLYTAVWRMFCSMANVCMHLHVDVAWCVWFAAWLTIKPCMCVLRCLLLPTAPGLLWS